MNGTAPQAYTRVKKKTGACDTVERNVGESGAADAGKRDGAESGASDAGEWGEAESCVSDPGEQDVADPGAADAGENKDDDSSSVSESSKLPRTCKSAVLSCFVLVLNTPVPSHQRRMST